MSKEAINGTWFKSPAKLNLFLHITGRRDDGYHELQTVFQFIDLFDELQFTQRQDTQINRTTELDFPADEDLSIRAAKLLQEKTQTQLGADICIKKRIPAGGGVGGGSSNAATSLLVLNQLWQCGLSIEELADLALSLGADVPIFVKGYAAWAEGVGEKIQPVNPPEQHFLLLSPQVHVSTAQIFSNSALTRNTLAVKIRALDEREAWQSFANDCELVVRQAYPEIDKAILELSKYAPAKLTGTGACLFAAFATSELANKAKRNLQDWADAHQVKVFVVKGMNRSPLHEQLLNS